MWPEPVIKYRITIPASDVGWEKAQENFFEAAHLIGHLVYDFGYSDRVFCFDDEASVDAASVILRNKCIAFEYDDY